MRVEGTDTVDKLDPERSTGIEDLTRDRRGEIGKVRSTVVCVRKQEWIDRIVFQSDRGGEDGVEGQEKDQE